MFVRGTRAFVCALLAPHHTHTHEFGRAAWKTRITHNRKPERFSRCSDSALAIIRDMVLPAYTTPKTTLPPKTQFTLNYLLNCARADTPLCCSALHAKRCDSIPPESRDVCTSISSQVMFRTELRPHVIYARLSETNKTVDNSRKKGFTGFGEVVAMFGFRGKFTMTLASTRMCVRAHLHCCDLRSAEWNNGADFCCGLLEICRSLVHIILIILELEYHVNEPYSS